LVLARILCRCCVAQDHDARSTVNGAGFDYWSKEVDALLPRCAAVFFLDIKKLIIGGVISWDQDNILCPVISCPTILGSVHGP
jgi:hypothetical protein